MSEQQSQGLPNSPNSEDQSGSYGGEIKSRPGLRLRFRPLTERTQWEPGDPNGPSLPHKGSVLDLASASSLHVTEPLESDSVRIFQEWEAERLALEEAIALLQHDLEQIQAGDLRVRVRSSHEKLQPVADAINSMVAQIRENLGEVQVLTQAVDEQTQKVKQSSELLVQGVMNHARTEHARTEQARTEHAHTEIKQARTEHIHTEIGHVPTNGYRDFEGPHSVSQVIDEMAATMQHISEQAAKVAQVAVEAMDVTLEGQSTVDRAVDGMGQVREATMQAARVMKRLGESGQEINDTVLTITDLTTRMNLLALNAAIEAVRAGEHGQGFAVIAQEMRTLAVHSTEAARKVETRMRTIQQETATAAVSVEQNTRQVVMQTELVTQTGVALDAISVVTEQMADLVQEIAELAKRAVAKRLSIPPRTGDDSIERRLESSTTSAAPPMINRGLLALHHAPTGQSQDSRPVVDSVEGISHMTGEIAQQISQVQQSLTHLVNLIQVLRSRVSVFRI